MNGSAKKIASVALMSILIGEGVLAVGIFVYFHRGYWNTPPATDEIFIPSESSLHFETGIPKTLIIPAIGVNAKIQSVGLDPNGSGDMGVPTNFIDAAWYNGGPHPGMDGSAVIDGHLSGKYVRNAVFRKLAQLKPGDMVEVVDEFENHIQFRVLEVKTYDHDAPAEAVFDPHTEKPHLNLITCAGDWSEDAQLFNKRTVVFTELMGVN